MKLERLHISVFLGLAALIWWLVLVAQGTQVSSAYWGPFERLSVVLSASG